MTPAEIIIAKIAENYRFQQAIEFADMNYAMGVAAKGTSFLLSLHFRYRNDRRSFPFHCILANVALNPSSGTLRGT